MTTHHDNQALLDAELAALGEPAAQSEERHVDDDADVRTVATLVAIASADVASAPPLSELSRRRVWVKLEGRIAAAGLAQALQAQRDHHHAVQAGAEVTDPAAGAANSGPGWRAVVAGLAVAAVLILPRLSTAPGPDAAPSPAEREALRAQGESVREAVSALGDHGESRARDLASSYAARLSSAEGGERQ